MAISHGCLRYCKSTSFQANHNYEPTGMIVHPVVCDTAKVRVFKQITTSSAVILCVSKLFAILQKYEFSSKSQHIWAGMRADGGCLRYCKSTSFQANHNCANAERRALQVVCDTAKVRVFKQITTDNIIIPRYALLFAILQKYEFSSKSQHIV